MNILDKIKEINNEIKLISRPSKKDLSNMIIMVLIFVIFACFFFFIIDSLLIYFITKIV